jgi:hypothetical protein
MSTTRPTPNADRDRIEVVSNDKEGTVTFVADRDARASEPPTEWITVPREYAVDVVASR